MAININAKTSGVGGLETSADNSGNINIQSGGSTVMSVTSSGVAVTGSFTQNGAVYSTQPSFRNLIINGDMRIDQRNAGASVTVNIGNQVFLVDRFYGQAQGGGAFTVQQSTVAPTGFSNSIIATVTSPDTSLAGTDFYVIKHRIEGNNIAHLNWGTANAKTVTLSFWVRSSLTGTFGGTLINSSENRSYPYSYTISSANTWEKKTVTITGDTTGTWLTNNGIGVSVSFTLGVGATYQGTSGSWSGSRFEGTTGQTQLIGTSGATFYITGVQLEKGSTATDFENLPYDVQLARCQRYCYKVSPPGVGNFTSLGSGVCYTTIRAICFFKLPTTMRDTPSMTPTTPTNVQLINGSNAETITAIEATGDGDTMRIDVDVASGLTTGHGAFIQIQSTTPDPFIFDAEL